MADKVLQCECGFEARAADEVELAAEIRSHARDAHGMTLSPDEALLLTFRADLGRIRTLDVRSSGPE
jgi:predicted small metal-binding protein